MTTAHVNSADYSYAYDAIGNRTSATEDGTRTTYTANKLNQYTAEGSFRPTFDADGNQTLIKTSTGTWNVTYNAKNRPVRFVKSDNSVTVECTYDTMGRRATKKVTTNGTLTEHRRFLYRGYLQIDSPPPHRRLTPAGQSRFAHCPTGLTAVGRLACCDLTRTYTPYGECAPAHTYDQPIQWSSEYHDVELGLVYYNYRHYNPAIGRWMGRDLIDESYLYANDIPSLDVDFLGLITWPWEQHQPDEPSSPNVNIEPFIGNDKLCSTCRSKLQGLKEYILRTYKFSGGNKCLIKLDCQDPTTWESPSTGAFYLPQITPEMKKGYVSGLIALPCNACKEGIILGVKSGAYVKHGFSDYAKHEIEHAIDYCKGNTSRSYIETRAYALHQVKRGPASRQQYIVLLRYRVKASTDVAKAEFSEDEFQRAIRDLGI